MPSQDDNKPALEPPPGQQSHFDGRNGSIQPAIIATLAVCLLVSTASVIMRAYTQKTIFRRYVWADGIPTSASRIALYLLTRLSVVWIVLGWTSHVSFAAMLLVCLPLGAGYHQWDVRLSAFRRIEFVSRHTSKEQQHAALTSF